MIDTAEKRRSALDFGKFCGTGMPIPSGLIPESGRGHILNLYSGILPLIGITIFWRNKNLVAGSWSSKGVPAGSWNERSLIGGLWASKASPSSSWAGKSSPSSAWTGRTPPPDSATQEI